MKIRQSEEKSTEGPGGTKREMVKPKIPIGKCVCFLMGFLAVESQAQIGEIKIEHRLQSKTKKDIIGILNMSDSYLGQPDKKFQAVFSDFLREKTCSLKGKILDAKLPEPIVKRMGGQGQFIKKMLIEVSCEHEVILKVVNKTRKKVKKWKWDEKEMILKYFEGQEVEFNKLYDDVVQSINLNESYQGNVAQLEANFNAAFQDVVTADDLEGIDPYEEIVETKLLQHQRVGIQWMSLRENFNGDDEDELPPFYVEKEDKETGDIKYVNIISDEEIDDLPEVGCGGILADDMGLGKTLQCISLIASNSGYKDKEDGDGPTLIIAPLTVIGNWVGQIGDHCAKDAFKILVYHGPNREKDLDVIKSYNVVITTFDIVALEYSDETDDNREEMRKHYGCGLQYVDWLRVVLDEAHKIRSRKTRVFKACNALQARSRWCLSGTPVQNRLDDIYSLFMFLKLQPICDKAFWQKFIVQPLKNGNPLGFDRLRKVMRQICLRRDKSMKIDGKPIITIPDKIKDTRVIEFNPEDKYKYQRLMAMNKERFQMMKKKGDKEIMRNFSSVLSMLLRLRQCCAHTLLVPELNNKSSLENMTLDDVIGKEDVLSNSECASCGAAPDDGALLTTCNHVYCTDCFHYELENSGDSFPCTLCGDKLTKKSIAEQRTAEEMDAGNSAGSGDGDEDKEDDDEDGAKKKKKRYEKFIVPDGNIVPSTKMQALIDDVKSWRGQEDGGRSHKAVVFSQWTSVLDIMARCLDQEEIMYERLDGSMSRATRDAAMESFRQTEDIPVFLMSLKAGNLGVNMTVANHVYMMDPWWNPATEDQAVDRVYRLGQKRNVHVNHFVIKDSVEEKILKIQLRKRKLIESAMGLQSKEDQKQQRKSEWLDDLKDLFTSK